MEGGIGFPEGFQPSQAQPAQQTAGPTQRLVENPAIMIKQKPLTGPEDKARRVSKFDKLFSNPNVINALVSMGAEMMAPVGKNDDNSVMSALSRSLPAGMNTFVEGQRNDFTQRMEQRKQKTTQQQADSQTSYAKSTASRAEGEASLLPLQRKELQSKLDVNVETLKQLQDTGVEGTKAKETALTNYYNALSYAEIKGANEGGKPGVDLQKISFKADNLRATYPEEFEGRPEAANAEALEWWTSLQVLRTATTLAMEGGDSIETMSESRQERVNNTLESLNLALGVLNKRGGSDVDIDGEASLPSDLNLEAFTTGTSPGAFFMEIDQLLPDGRTYKGSRMENGVKVLYFIDSTGKVVKDAPTGG